MKQTAAVGRQIEQEHAVMAHTGTVDIEKLGDAFHLTVLHIVVEPARTDRHIGLGRNIGVAAEHSMI